MHSGSGEDSVFDGEPWDVGRLRQVLDGLPDDMPLVVVAEYEPGEIETYRIVQGGPASLTVQPWPADADELMLVCRLQDGAEDEDEDEL